MKINLVNLKVIFILIIITNLKLFAQYNGRNFSISLDAVYTTTAKIYLSPNSSDQVIRNSFFGLSDILNPGIDLKYRLTDYILIGFGTEYMKKTAQGRNLTVFSGNQTQSISVEDGFILIPFEFSIYYAIPFSTERFKFLMGGGGAYYYGEHVRKFGNVKVSNLERKAAYGIHVMISLDYMIKENISLHGEMKFRDPQFTVKSEYSQRTVEYEGGTITLAQSTFDSKVNIDGISFIIGLAFHF